ncbi:MAG: hypothetical protein V1927_07180 [Candidatus Omnitrophota bacterium]
MKKRGKRLIKARKSWTRNPRTRIKESRRIYKRPKIKKETIRVYEDREDKIEA